MDSQIEEVKNKLNILDVVGGYMKLTKTGINYRGICPFHAEKTPSFFVSPSRQTWHCFGCGAGFSIFDFVMKIEGVEFGDALKILARKAGVELKRENPQLRTERQRLYEICELATRFFEKQLFAGEVGKSAKDYLLKRGITEDSIKKWRVGYSPDIWQGLTEFLIGKGYQREEIIKAGLAIEKEGAKGNSYDRFRGRIIFPVFDLNSQVVGFGGRVFSARGGSAFGGKQAEQNTAKYINTPQTMLYDKSATLYGLNNAKLSVRKQNQCVVTEGYTDVIMCHQAGFENTVAASGTALTERHLNILKRYSENLVLAFDADPAGDSATKRGISMAQEMGFNIKIVESYGLKGEKSDPADIILKDPKIWQESVEKSRSIMDYYFAFALDNFNKTLPEGKKEISKIILPAIKSIKNKIEQSHWIQKLAEAISTKEDAILEELAKLSASKNYAIGAEKNDRQVEKENLGTEGRRQLIEEKIISLILKNPNNANLLEESHYPLFSDKIGAFLREIKVFLAKSVLNDGELHPVKSAEGGVWPKAGQFDRVKEDFKEIFSNSLSDSQQDAEFKNLMAALALRADMDYQEDGEAEMKLCLSQLKSVDLKDRLNKISEQVKKAEDLKDQTKAKELIEEFHNLSKQL